ncbi:unnamed protein product [Dicrocoelium dendriticum]|nr:unnamed protein product [Dicrocoelium dendriticum]
MRARLTQLLSILVASVLPSFVACIQNLAPAYPEITDPGISKRAADQKLAEFEKVYKNVMRVRPKNAILFIGDGMSVSTVVGARYLKAVNLGLAAGELHLEWENWPSVALVRTHNADRMTTESASSATAILGGK